MRIAGACPGMVMAEVGSGVPNALIVLAGGFAGALAYGLLQPLIPVDGHSLFARGRKPFFNTCAARCVAAMRFLHFTLLPVARRLDGLGLPFLTTSVALFAGMFAFVAFLEVAFPWRAAGQLVMASSDGGLRCSLSLTATSSPSLVPPSGAD